MITQEKVFRCPFVYAKGHRCEGHVFRVKAYGSRSEVRKLRFWCSEGYDHQGTVSSRAGKERMEFYPDRVPNDLQPIVQALNKSGYELHI